MTQWVDPGHDSVGGDPQSLARAWAAVLIRPRRFFATAVRPGDQAPGLLFVSAVAAIAATTRVIASPARLPPIDPPLLAGVLVVGLVALLVAPLGLHLIAALQTVALIALVDDRAGVSETVQIIAYATAPCVVAGLPVPAIRLGAAVYGTVLLVVGTAVVNDVPLPVAAAVAALPAMALFGLAYGGVSAVGVLV